MWAAALDWYQRCTSDDETMTCCQKRKQLNDSSICFLSPGIHRLIKSGSLSFTFCSGSGSEAALVSAAISSPAFPLMLQGLPMLTGKFEQNVLTKDFCDSLTPLGNINKELISFSGSLLITESQGGQEGLFLFLLFIFWFRCWFKPIFLSVHIWLYCSAVDTSPVVIACAYALCMFLYNNACVLSRALNKSHYPSAGTMLFPSCTNLKLLVVATLEA